jgi:hypothetical protein
MNDPSANQKTEPQKRLLLQVALGIMLIGLTISNAHIIYSQPDPDVEVEEDGEEEVDDEEEADREDTDGEVGEDKLDEAEEADEVDRKVVLAAKIVEVCDNNVDDDADSDIDQEDSDCEVESGKISTSAAEGTVICNSEADADSFPCYTPVADAGPDKVVNEGESVKLEGHGSDKDTPEDELVYSWGIEDDDEDCPVAGELTDGKDTLTPVFASYDVPKDCSIAFELAVEDTRGNIGNDLVLVTVRNVETSPTPSISVRTDKPVYRVGENVNILGEVTGVENPEGDIHLQITDPDEEEFGYYDTTLEKNGSFGYEREKIEGEGGKYRVTASYVTPAESTEIQAEAPFELKVDDIPAPPTEVTPTEVTPSTELSSPNGDSSPSGISVITDSIPIWIIPVVIVLGIVALVIKHLLKPAVISVETEGGVEKLC